MKTNLAQEPPIPQGELVHFPKKERQDMSKKDEGYTKTPNSLIDDQIMAQLNDKAFKCLMFIVRQTIGFDRDAHEISITQFQKYCGIKKRDTVIACIKELEDCNLIQVDRKTGRLNQFKVTIDQYRQTGLVPSKGSTTKRDGTSTMKGDGTSTAKRDYTSPVQRDTIKETFKENIKENFKENVCSENPVDAVLKLWTPNLDSLNAWLQRSGIAKMTQSEVDGWLLEINGYYSTKLEAGLLTDTQMYTNFVKWIKRNFSIRKPAPKAQEKIDSRNVNAAWENINPDYSNAGEPVELEDWML
ncbi:replication protein [Acinetobacter baumannii]|uniref:replication protein n=1 Tax=Acinetobacter baumannii TaxID=470 RepID=UPI0024468D41|nr:replication protein [Acinetobacter baumannii]MDG9779495.1 replication protein [Acinetobacter baumannii]MDH0778634.1 replication protein [Acinetobacter baumannii]